MASYADLPRLLIEGMQQVPLPRTGLPLASKQGQLTFFDFRTFYQATLDDALPCIIVDIDDQRPIKYTQMGSEVTADVPLLLEILVPVFAFLPNRSPAEIAEDLRVAGEDILQLVWDVESLFTHIARYKLAGMDIQLTQSGVGRDVIGFNEQTPGRARVAVVELTARRVVHPI